MKIGKVMLTEKEIANRIDSLADKINKEYGDEEVIVLGVLKGCFVFMSDLIRKLTCDVRTYFMDGNIQPNILFHKYMLRSGISVCVWITCGFHFSDRYTNHRGNNKIAILLFVICERWKQIPQSCSSLMKAWLNSPFPRTTSTR